MKIRRMSGTGPAWIRTAAWTASLWLGPLALAQEPAPVHGPVAGFVFELAAGIRPVLGVPGAATLGEPILSRAGIVAVVFPPSGDYALAVAGRERRLALLRDLSFSGSLTDLPLAAGAGRVAISPAGRAAAVYYPETRTVAVLAGLPGSAVVLWSAEPPYMAGGLGALAVSDRGDAVLLAAAEGHAPVWLLSPDAGPRVLSAVSAGPSLAFLSGSLDALIADGEAGVVTLVRDPKGTAAAVQIGGPADGVTRPVAVAATPDNRRVLVANAEPAGILSLSLSGEEPLALPCNCGIGGLEPLPGAGAFRVSGPGASPVWLLDAAAWPPRLVFVPDSQPVQRRVFPRPAPVRRGGDR